MSWSRPPPPRGGRTSQRTGGPGSPRCTFRFNGPYKAAGYAQGDASNECVTKVTRMEIYGTLLKLYNGTWYNMVTRSQAKDYVAGKVEVHPRWDCVANSPYRNWDFLADSYTLHVGVWYYAGNYNYNWLYCG